MHRYSMKPSRRQKENGLMAYRAGANFCMNNIQDILVKQFTTHTRISTSSGGRAGGGGRSTTHTSSSGRSHGGGGGRF